MAENDNAQGTQGGAQPGIDMDALGALFDRKLNEGLQSVVNQIPRQAAPARQADPVGDMVRPYVEPAVKQAMVAAEAAGDKADFYSSESGQGLETAERAEIEKTFNTMLQNGRPMSRNDIWAWMQGQDIDKTIAKRQQKQQAKVDAARAAGDAGAGTGGRDAVKPGSVDAYSLDPDALAKALEGASF